MRLGDLLKNVEVIDTEADLEMDITGVGCDSATMRPGELFVAIKGFTADGHSFIESAAEKGASCVICERKPDTAMPYIVTSNSRKAMAIVSAAWFGNPASKIKLIAVTGTNGKTTVTHLIKHIIEECSGSKVGLIGTIGNLIGGRELAATLTTPDSYELQRILGKMAFEGCEYAVMEVSSHALCLHRVYGIEYEIGIFTNLTPEHLDFHPTMEDYADAKAMLFPNCRNSVVNIDSEYANRMIESSGGKVMTYAVKDMYADIVAKNIQLSPDNVEFDVLVNGKEDRAKLHIPGMFSVYNALAAMGAGIILGYDTQSIEKALHSSKGVKGRAEVLRTGGDYTVLVDYAHTPDALENIIKTARSIAEGRVITLFGCGGDRDRTKRPKMGAIAMDLSDIVFVTSDNPRTENPGAIVDDIVGGIENAQEMKNASRLKVIVDRREAIYEALGCAAKGDVLVIAGKGHETYQILGREKTHFDDREVVDDYLRQVRESKRKSHLQLEGLD